MKLIPENLNFDSSPIPTSKNFVLVELLSHVFSVMVTTTHLYTMLMVLGLLGLLYHLSFFIFAGLVGDQMARISTPFLGFLVLVLCCHASNMAKVTGYTAYTDPNQSIRIRIRDLMMRMTLQEKIGQMVQIERANASAEIMNKFFIGD